MMKTLRNALISVALMYAASGCATTRIGTDFNVQDIKLPRQAFVQPAYAGANVGEIKQLSSSEQSTSVDPLWGNKIRKDVHAYEGTKVSEVRTVPFSDYHPSNPSKKLELADKILEAYVTQGISCSDLTQLVEKTTWSSHRSDRQEFTRVRIGNFESFSDSVYAVIDRLKESDDWTNTLLTHTDIDSISIHDAVLLSGKVTAYQLEFEEDMIAEGELSFTDKMKGKDNRPERAKEIDGMSHDDIFAEGRGVCRNYSGVNSAVFEVLKAANQNLQNTYMTYMHPDNDDAYFNIGHAWNKVCTLVEEEGKTVVYGTHVDPQWLDEANHYEGLDEHHFGYDNIAELAHRAHLYESLAVATRIVMDKYPLSNYDAAVYLSMASDTRKEMVRVFEDRMLEEGGEEAIEEHSRQLDKIHDLEHRAIVTAMQDPDSMKRFLLDQSTVNKTLYEQKIEQMLKGGSQ